VWCWCSAWAHRSKPSFAKRLQLLALLSKQMASTVVMPQCGARWSKCSTRLRPTPPAAAQRQQQRRQLQRAGHVTAHAAQAAEHGYFRGGFVAVAVLPQSAARSRTSAREEHLKVCEGRPCNNASGCACGDYHRAARDVSAVKPLAHGENKALARLLRRHSPARALQCSAAAYQPSRLQLRRSRCRCCGTGA
jgi:hypothetical protein